MTEGKEMYEREVQRMKYENLCNTLSGYEQKGVRISVQGIEFPVDKSAEIMTVNENECYMPDIEMDNFGKVVSINYDRIVLG